MEVGHAFSEFLALPQRLFLLLAIAGVALWFHGGGATPAFADPQADPGSQDGPLQDDGRNDRHKRRND